MSIKYNILSGACLCKKIKFEINIISNEENCYNKKNNKFIGKLAPYLKTFPENLKIYGSELVWYSNNLKTMPRGFCQNCGNRLFYKLKEEIYVAVEALNVGVKLNRENIVYITETGDNYLLNGNLINYHQGNEFITPQIENNLGKQILIELSGVSNFDEKTIKSILFKIATYVKGNILHHHFHQFPQIGAITGFLLLAESHISIHTWPEKKFISLDVFMCNNFDVLKVKKMVFNAFCPTAISIKENLVGKDNLF